MVLLNEESENFGPTHTAIAEQDKKGGRNISPPFLSYLSLRSRQSLLPETGPHQSNFDATILLPTFATVVV